MGGRGSSGGSKIEKSKDVRTVHGVSVSERLFAKESDISKMSPNTIWIENTSNPHAILRNSLGSTQIRGNKKDLKC